MSNPLYVATASRPGPETSPSVSRRLVVVTGLSGAGRSSVLRILKDLGYETVDNLPAPLLDALLADSDEASLAVGIDARTRGLDVPALGAVLEEFRARADLDLWVVFITADAEVLLRRFSEMLRRHPLTPGNGNPVLLSGVTEGVAREGKRGAPLRDAADWLLDTSDLPSPELRRQVEHRFQIGSRAQGGSCPPSPYALSPSQPDCFGMRA